MPKMKTGRRSVFRNKTERVQGMVTKEAFELLTRARRRLAAMTGRTLEKISIGDGVEYAIRGDQGVSEYLKLLRRRGW